MRTPSVQAWMGTLPESIVAGKGSESLLTAAHVFSALSRQRYAGSLDFTKCYDLMVPRGTAGLMEAGGWPQGLVRVIIAYMWQHQQRWMSWDRHSPCRSSSWHLCAPRMFFWAVGSCCLDGRRFAGHGAPRRAGVHSGVHG